LTKKVIDNKEVGETFNLEILRTDDNEEEIAYFTEMFHDLLTQPFQSETFDFLMKYF
jgi:hypothetical protein